MNQRSIEQKQEKIEEALYHLIKHETECNLCPRECGVDRKAGEKGYCEAAIQASLSHAVLHLGEEPVLSGLHDCSEATDEKPVPRMGSGALFFSRCNLKCCFCQNYQISWLNKGKERTSIHIAKQMIALQDKGAHNINLVSPSHFLLPVLRALQKAFARGLSIPLVYNSNGYEKPEIIQYLDGIMDIYLPDCKYFSSKLSRALSNAPDYFSFASASIREMFRQKPVLTCDNQGIAQKGLIVRHLVLPGHGTDSMDILHWLARNCREGIALSLMSQYKPCHKAPVYLQRDLSTEEYDRVMQAAYDLSFETLFIQPESFTQQEHRTPDFNRKNPFDWS